MSFTAVRPNVWIMAARPKTLGAAVAPVLVGTAMAVEAGTAHGPSALLALLGAILIQVGVNYHNDYYDFLKGADTDDRVGPTRVTQAGLVDPETMRRATFLVFSGAVVAGMYLIWRGGWPVLAIGVASIAAAIAYTAGRYALAYTGLADLFVFVFFGPVAVGGTYYVQALTIRPEVLIAGAGPGLLSVGILLVNNIRDVAEDRRAEKRTLVVRVGRKAAIGLYAACVLGALLVPVGIYVWTGQHPWSMGTLALLPLVVSPVQRLRSTADPEALNPLLGATGRLLVLWAVIFAIGWNV